MNSKFKRITALFLASLTVSMTAACSSDNGGDTETKANPVNDAETTTATETQGEPTDEEKLAELESSLEKIDYDGYTFTVVDRTGSALWTTVDVFSEGQNGDPINDAVYERNSILENTYNIKIEEMKMGGLTNATNSIFAGEDIFDTITHPLMSIASSYVGYGAILDITDIPEIKLENDWWDHRLIEGLSIGGHVLMITGDISIMDNYGTWGILFNKDILNDYSLDDPYALVNDGTWTIDKMHDMAKTAAKDLDGDGKMGDWDQYGLLTESYNTFSFWLSTGERITGKNSDDNPILTMYNERSVKAVEKALDIQLDETCTVTEDRHSKGINDGVNALFGMGKGLFIYGGLWLITQYRSSDVDFGVIPAPKLDETQEEYHSAYTVGNLTVYCIPVTVSDTSRTGTILESMAALSKYTLTPAYHDISLEGKFLRDEQSSEMIDLILDTRNFDLGAVYNWGGLFSIFGDLYKEKSYDFASKYSAVEEAAGSLIEYYGELIENKYGK